MQKSIECVAANWYVSNLAVLVSELVSFSENMWFYFQSLEHYLIFLGLIVPTISDSKPFLCQKNSKKI